MASRVHKGNGRDPDVTRLQKLFQARSFPCFCLMLGGSLCGCSMCSKGMAGRNCWEHANEFKRALVPREFRRLGKSRATSRPCHGLFRSCLFEHVAASGHLAGVGCGGVHPGGGGSTDSEGAGLADALRGSRHERRCERYEGLHRAEAQGEVAACRAGVQGSKGPRRQAEDGCADADHGRNSGDWASRNFTWLAVAWRSHRCGILCFPTNPPATELGSASLGVVCGQATAKKRTKQAARTQCTKKTNCSTRQRLAIASATCLCQKMSREANQLMARTSTNISSHRRGGRPSLWRRRALGCR